MSKSTKTIIFVIFLTFVIIVGFIIYQIYLPTNFSGEKEFIITKGESVNQISRHLVAEKIIRSPLIFQIYIYLAGLESSLQAGNYVLTPMNIAELATIFSAGKVDNEIDIKIIEGWTIKDLAKKLVQQKIISTADEFLAAADINKYKNNYEFLKNQNIKNLEGFIFPDTYRVYKDATAEEIINKALANFQNKITPAMQTEITAQGKNLYQIIIMASIIESEMPHENDRSIVSGILWKRLNQNMPLQVDATLKYIIGKENRASLTYEELKIDSQYNTYKYQGLPPTPISNPGFSAIRAAIYPKNSDYLFYLSTKTGETIFSKTAEEHNAAVNKYLR